MRVGLMTVSVSAASVTGMSRDSHRTRTGQSRPTLPLIKKSPPDPLKKLILTRRVYLARVRMTRFRYAPLVARRSTGETFAPTASRSD